MDVTLKYNRQMRSLSIAMGTAISAAVGAMFIPTAILESVTGATGLSETIPATAAPLGDTARALIAFGAGALILAAMTAMLLSADKKPLAQVPEDVSAEGRLEEDPKPSLLDRLAGLKWPSISAPQWPWQKHEDDITEFTDLPKLRGNDIHPDAPPRRPLSATSDLPVLDLLPAQMNAAPAPQSNPMASVTTAEAVLSPMPLAPNPQSVDNQPLIADMVAQLEAAVAQRQRQLNELEAVAAKLSGSQLVQPIAPAVEPEPENLPEPIRSARPVLEAVPSTPVKQEDIDDALEAALATLHRMNGTDR